MLDPRLAASYNELRGLTTEAPPPSYESLPPPPPPEPYHYPLALRVAFGIVTNVLSIAIAPLFLILGVYPVIGAHISKDIDDAEFYNSWMAFALRVKNVKYYVMPMHFVMAHIFRFKA